MTWKWMGAEARLEAVRGIMRASLSRVETQSLYGNDVPQIEAFAARRGLVLPWQGGEALLPATAESATVAPTPECTEGALAAGAPEPADGGEGSSRPIGDNRKPSAEGTGVLQDTPPAAGTDADAPSPAKGAAVDTTGPAALTVPAGDELPPVERPAGETLPAHSPGDALFPHDQDDETGVIVPLGYALRLAPEVEALLEAMAKDVGTPPARLAADLLTALLIDDAVAHGEAVAS